MRHLCDEGGIMLELGPIDPKQVEMLNAILPLNDSQYRRYSRAMVGSICRSMGIPLTMMEGGGNYSSPRGIPPTRRSVRAMVLASKSYYEANRVMNEIMSVFKQMFRPHQQTTPKRRPQISSRRMNTAKRLARRKMNRFNKRRNRSNG
jgi:hypothetical protein